MSDAVLKGLFVDFFRNLNMYGIKVMEVHVDNIDRLKLRFINDGGNNITVNKHSKDIFLTVDDLNSIRLAQKPWWIEYCWDANMPRHTYFQWRPSYKNLLKFDLPIAVEVGVLEGFNAELALQFIDFKKYYMVDPYKEYVDSAIINLNGLKQADWDEIYQKVVDKFSSYKNAQIIRQTSEEVSKCFRDESVNFVYIDADHTKKSVLNDITYWYSKVKSGGYICGHDAQNSEVQSAVYDFFIDKFGQEDGKQLLSENLNSEFNDWWVRKP